MVGYRRRPHAPKGTRKRAKRELVLPFNAAEGIPGFDTSEHETYTEEEPNTLTGEEAASFLARMKDEFPAQYAMTFLGFATGLRPSTLRPLRRTGPTPDVRWDAGVILVRRSHTIREELMNTTKTNLRQRITVPSEVMDVLRWHVDTQLTTLEQKESQLLFPAEDGRFRSPSFLKKAFATVGQLISLNKSFTPVGMRRTFNDLMRLAKVEAVVTKSISGHLTERRGRRVGPIVHAVGSDDGWFARCACVYLGIPGSGRLHPRKPAQGPADHGRAHRIRAGLGRSTDEGGRRLHERGAEGT